LTHRVTVPLETSLSRYRFRRHLGYQGEVLAALGSSVKVCDARCVGSSIVRKYPEEDGLSKLILAMVVMGSYRHLATPAAGYRLRTSARRRFACEDVARCSLRGPRPSSVCWSRRPSPLVRSASPERCSIGQAAARFGFGAVTGDDGLDAHDSGCQVHRVQISDEYGWRVRNVVVYP